MKADEQGRADVVAERAEFAREMEGVRAEDLMAIDEAAITTDRVRMYARAARGERAHGSAPRGHWKKLTLLGAIALGREPVLMSIEASTDTDVFVAFVRKVLVPSLRPGQMVLMDNLIPNPGISVDVEHEPAPAGPLPPTPSPKYCIDRGHT